MDEEIIEQVQTVGSIHETLTGYTGKRLRVRHSFAAVLAKS